MNMSMKQAYSRPSLQEYGRLESLTLGPSGSLPDYDAQLNVVNNSCPTGTFLENGTTQTRVACVNNVGVGVGS